MARLQMFCWLLTLLIPLVCGEDTVDTVERDQKLLSSFQIVRFPNDGCVGSNNRNGTCYTSQECSSKKGSSSGSCADGFGVCCIFIISACGMTTAENSTSWTNPTTVTAGACKLTVCPSAAICSLRLDFTTFVITGPNTLIAPTVRRRFGAVTQDGSDQAYALGGSSYTSNCMIDSFYTTSASPSTNPPSVCGTLSAEHMYVEADADRCNMLQFTLGDAASTAAFSTNNRGQSVLANRMWDITVSQIECTSASLPPAGCTKYWFGPTGTAQLRSYNFQAAGASSHLAMQHERMCIRRERGNCVGCFATIAANVQLSGRANGVTRTYTYPGGCCGYTSEIAAAAPLTTGSAANDGTASATGPVTQFGFDCIIIPGAFVPVTYIAIAAQNQVPVAAQGAATIRQALTQNPTAGTGPVPSGPQICGNGAGLGVGVNVLSSSTQTNVIAAIAAAGFNTNLSICTRNAPFVLEFMSDDLEGLGSTANGSEQLVNTNLNRGFSITHTQLGC